MLRFSHRVLPRGDARAWPAAVAAAIALLLVLITPAAAGAASVRADFDGDGRDDLAIGAPLDSVGGHPGAGAVNVVYGSPTSGLSARGDQQFTQDTRGMVGIANRDDGFGAALAAGDLDGNGFADLAIGVPGEDAGAVEAAGAVHVLYGSARGLTVVGNDFVFEDAPGMQGDAAAYDFLGSALAIGRFHDSGQAASLAIGVPGDDVGERRNAGSVSILRGGAGGIGYDGKQRWTGDSSGIPGVAAAYAAFGAALASGDLTRDGRDDLAIGAPGRLALEPEDPIPGGGTVTVLYGSAAGLGDHAAQTWSQDSPGVKGRAGLGDGFGATGTVADLDADGVGDLAIGVPYDTVAGRADAGAVNVLYGSRNGLRADRDQLWSQDVRGIKDRTEVGDTFGAALTAGDFWGDRAADLVVGIPREDLQGRADVGMAQILQGGAGGGLHPTDSTWHQDRRGVKGSSEPGDLFGAALAAGDFDDDSALDLAVSAPFDSVGGVRYAGAVTVLYGSSSAMSSDDWLLTQDAPGIKGTVGADAFGSTLAGAG
jgi:hypothetical protein